MGISFVLAKDEASPKALCPDNIPAQRKLLREFCEEQVGKSSDEILANGAKLPPSFKDAFPTLYHYADADTLKFFADDLGDGVWRLRGDDRLHVLGKYLTSSNLFQKTTAQSKGQLPRYLDESGNWALEPSKGRFKCIIELNGQNIKLSIPPAKSHSGAENAGTKQWLEALVKENPHLGQGDINQLTSKDEIICRVFDLDTGQFVKDKEHLNQLLNQ